MLQVNGLGSHTLALVLDMMTRYLPAGVHLSLSEPDMDLIEFTYVPDVDLKALHKELEDLDKEY